MKIRKLSNRYRMILVACIVIAAISVLCISCDSKSSGTDGKKVIKLRVAHTANSNSHIHKGLEYFCRLLEERSDGVLQPSLYGNSVLGGARVLLEGLQLNTIQIAAPAAAPLSAFDSKLMLCDMPFLFDDHEHAERVLDGQVGQQIAADLPKNCRIRVLAYWVSGFRSVFSKKGPIESIEDIKEIKIRVMESPVFIDVFLALGAIPTPMAFGELYTSLAQGVVDAAENDAESFLTMRFYEVCKYFSLTEHAYCAMPLVISEKFFQSLSKELQAVVQQAACDARDYERQLAKQANEQALKKLEAEGVRINTLDTTAFKKAVAVVYKKYEQQIGPDILNMVLDER